METIQFHIIKMNLRTIFLHLSGPIEHIGMHKKFPALVSVQCRSNYPQIPLGY